MIRYRLAAGLALASILLVSFRYGTVRAEDIGRPQLKAGKPINIGDALAGELDVLQVLDRKSGKKIVAYQITSEPRQLPSPNGLCGLETGPETFQLTTIGDAAAELSTLVGRKISVKVDDIACAENAADVSEAVVRKWRLVKGH
ncbi:hypothetical protein [Bradyrhizobium sp. ARR65]|uniref:hypothetical protein n=1 Tax=Bradyrhizobium sp. ARR65 TaxID=1040989 RepID=UPI000465E2B8|nr:hypothetical protein [Bradyrhizobium sp. ARR65]